MFIHLWWLIWLVYVNDNTCSSEWCWLYSWSFHHLMFTIYGWNDWLNLKWRSLLYESWVAMMSSSVLLLVDDESARDQFMCDFRDLQTSEDIISSEVDLDLKHILHQITKHVNYEILDSWTVFNSFSAGIDVGRHILTSKVDPCNERLKHS